MLSAQKAEEAAASEVAPSLSEAATAKAPLNSAADGTSDALIASKPAGGKRKREEDPEAAAKAAARKEEEAITLAKIDWRAELEANTLKKRTVPQLKAYCIANGLKAKAKKVCVCVSSLLSLCRSLSPSLPLSLSLSLARSRSLSLARALSDSRTFLFSRSLAHSLGVRRRGQVTPQMPIQA